MPIDFSTNIYEPQLTPTPPQPIPPCETWITTYGITSSSGANYRVEYVYNPFLEQNRYLKQVRLLDGSFIVIQADTFVCQGCGIPLLKPIENNVAPGLTLCEKCINIIKETLNGIELDSDGEDM